jgi:hypothetical protein
MTYYKGWLINNDQYCKTNNKWGASRFGVTMCANSKELLYTMIDLRPILCLGDIINSYS